MSNENIKAEEKREDKKELGKEEMKLLHDTIWKDIETLKKIHVRYLQLLQEFTLGGGALGSIFRSNYSTYTGIIISLSTILGKIIYK